MPTRITDHSATLIEHILVRHTPDTINNDIISGNIFTDITDHLPNFVLYGSCKQSCVSKNRPFIRFHGAKHVDALCNYLDNDNVWEGINLNSCADCNVAFEKYGNIVNERYIKCCPLVQLSQKRQKDKKVDNSRTRE